MHPNSWSILEWQWRSTLAVENCQFQHHSDLKNFVTNVCCCRWERIAMVISRFKHLVVNAGTVRCTSQIFQSLWSAVHVNDNSEGVHWDVPGKWWNLLYLKSKPLWLSNCETYGIFEFKLITLLFNDCLAPRRPDMRRPLTCKDPF